MAYCRPQAPLPNPLMGFFSGEWHFVTKLGPQVSPFPIPIFGVNKRWSDGGRWMVSSGGQASWLGLGEEVQVAGERFSGREAKRWRVGDQRPTEEESEAIRDVSTLARQLLESHIDVKVSTHQCILVGGVLQRAREELSRRPADLSTHISSGVSEVSDL
jgi:hypothetical protein